MARLPGCLGNYGWFVQMKTKTERWIDLAILAEAFNEWFAHFLDNPGRFEQLGEAVTKFKEDQRAWREPSYGSDCTAYLLKLYDENRHREGRRRPRKKG